MTFSCALKSSIKKWNWKMKPISSVRRRKLRGPVRWHVTGDEDGDDREQRCPKIMSPIPNYQEMVGVKQPANMYWNLRNSPRQQRPENAAAERTDPGDERTLPEKNRGDVDPPVAHRAQDRDFPDFRKHGHRQHVKNPETG